MSNSYSFTYIILYRHSSERLANLKRVLDWINGFSGAEVLIVEQDKHSKISNLNLKCKHIFTKSDGPFNRSWGFNVGLKYANSEIIVFADSDLIMMPNDFIESLKLIDKYDMVSPYSSVVDLEQNESSSSLEYLSSIRRPGRGEEDNQKINICGGISIFRKESILNIGGWDQSFIGWGGEDDALAIKVKNFLNWYEKQGRCYHLYHSRVVPDMKYYQKNLQLLNKIAEMSKDELKRYMSIGVKNMGIKNLNSI